MTAAVLYGKEDVKIEKVPIPRVEDGEVLVKVQVALTCGTDLKVYQRDIAELPTGEVMRDLRLEPGELDLLVGGPPCQTFSTTGKRATVQDPRGTLPL